MKFNNFIKTLGVASATPFVPLLVVSCSESHVFSEKSFDYSEVDWSQVRYFDATVSDIGDGEGWNDGDTFTFDFDTLDTTGLGDATWPSYEGSAINRVRLMNIDTPEMGSSASGDYIETDGVEREIAEAGKDFANEVMPAGTTVRVLTNMQTTYDRIVGTVFYGDNFENNWEVEVMKRGLAQPSLDNSQIINEVSATWSAMHYVASPMFHNFQYAKERKIGMWKYDLVEVYGTRGVGDWTAMEKGMAADTDGNLGYNF